MTAKLGDFGLAARLPESGYLTSVCGSHDFLAPEMIRTGHGDRAGYGCSVDIWAFGLMLHGLLFGVNPFERDTDVETLQAILAGEYAVPTDRGATLAVRDLLASMLVADPQRRASAEELVGHSWTCDALKPSAVYARRAGQLIRRLWARAG